MNSKYSLGDIFRDIGAFLSSKELNFDIYSNINDCLGFCAKLPTIDLVSIYLLNEETYEFEHRFTLPKDLRSLSLEFFNYMLENGIVGESLEDGNYKSMEINKQVNESNSNERFIIFPLISSSKVLGLLLFKLTDDSEKVGKEDIITVLIFLSRYFALFIENMLLQSVLVKTNDIIEQDSALKSIDIRRNLIEMESIINSLEVGIFIVNHETDEITLSNFYSAKLTGYKQNELNQKKVTEIFRTDQSTSKKSEKKELFISGTKSFESTIINLSGKPIPVIRSISFTNIRTKRYRIDSFIDISFRKEKDLILEKEMKELELKFRERTEDLLVIVSKLKQEIKEKEKVQKEIETMLNKEKELNIMKSNFITMVSHEFRSPLTKIKSAAQMIDKFGKKLTNEEKSDYILRIIGTVDQMSGLLENVSLIGGTDLSDLVIDPKETNALILLKQIISNLNINYGKPDKIVLSTDCDKLIVKIDEKLFKTICFNALSNAIKHSDEDQKINLFISDTDGELVLIMNDLVLNLGIDELEMIKQVISEGKIIDNLPANCINWSVVVTSVQLHKGKISLIEKDNNCFSIVINIPLIN